MFRKRALILAQMAAAVGVCLAVIYGDWPHISVNLQSPDAGERLRFMAQWFLIPTFCLAVGVAMTATQRFFSRTGIDGEREHVWHALEINLRYNRNTLEQLVLAAVAWTGLALTLPGEQLSIIPKLAILFGVGRTTFWIGYLIKPWARAFGMALTFYSTFGVLIWLGWNAI